MPRLDPNRDRLDDTRLLSALAPLLQQAMDTSELIADADRRNRDFEAALDAVAVGIVIVGPHGRVMHANPAAERMLAAEDGIGIRQGSLDSGCVRTSRAVGRAVRRALDAHPADGECLAVDRPSGRRPFVVRVIPLTHEDRPSRRSALVIIADPEREPEPESEALRRLYGLTAAEAQIAIRVLTGRGLHPIADELSMSVDVNARSGGAAH